MPKRIERQGTRKVHSRELDGAGKKARTERREASQKARQETRQKERTERTPKGWAGRRAGRVARGG